MEIFLDKKIRKVLYFPQILINLRLKITKKGKTMKKFLKKKGCYKLEEKIGYYIEEIACL